MVDRGELFRPTVSAPKRRPWRFWWLPVVALFSGPIGVTVIMVVHGSRLQAPRNRLVAVALIGIAGTVGAVAGFAARGTLDDPRPVVILSGAVVVAAQMYVLIRWERVALMRDVPRASLLLPGLAAVIVGAALLALLTLPFVDL